MEKVVENIAQKGQEVFSLLIRILPTFYPWLIFVLDFFLLDSQSLAPPAQALLEKLSDPNLTLPTTVSKPAFGPKGYLQNLKIHKDFKMRYSMFAQQPYPKPQDDF